MGKGASLTGRATRASTEPASSLGHTASVPSADLLIKIAQLLAEYRLEQAEKASAWTDMGGVSSRLVRAPVVEAAHNRAVAIQRVLDELYVALGEMRAAQ